MKKLAAFIVLVIILQFEVNAFSESEQTGLQNSSESSSAYVDNAKPTADLIDKTKVQDPALKQVLQQIEEKLAAIKEYSYVEEVSSIVKNGELAYREERCFRRPNLFFSKLTQTKHISLDMIGSVTYSVVDGENLWKYVQNAPGSGEKMVERIKVRGKLPPAEIEKMIKRHEAPQIYKYSLQRLRQAGYSAEDIVRSGTLLKPFRSCDMATLKLDRQDASVWVFVAKPNIPMMGTNLLRLTVNKNDGILQKVEFLGADGNVLSTQLILNVRLQPDFPKTFFTFSPPPGIEINDDTETMIQSLQRQGIQPTAQSSSQ
jgi:outer membrane lipoprotein-sorting protein